MYVFQVVSSKLNLVDLAGSERLKKALDQVRARRGHPRKLLSLVDRQASKRKNIPDSLDDYYTHVCRRGESRIRCRLRAIQLRSVCHGVRAQIAKYYHY